MRNLFLCFIQCQKLCFLVYRPSNITQVVKNVSRSKNSIIENDAPQNWRGLNSLVPLKTHVRDESKRLGKWLAEKRPFLKRICHPFGVRIMKKKNRVEYIELLKVNLFFLICARIFEGYSMSKYYIHIFLIISRQAGGSLKVQDDKSLPGS